MWMGLGKSKQVFPWCLPTGLGGIYKLSHPNLVNILDSAGQNANKTRWPSIFCPHWYRKFIGLVQRIMDNLQKPPIFHGGKPHFHVDVISERVLRWKKRTAILRSPLIFLVFVLGLHLLRQVNHLLPWDSDKNKRWKIKGNHGETIHWLVVYLPLWKIWVRQLGLLFPIYGKIKNVPNHQPVYCHCGCSMISKDVWSVSSNNIFQLHLVEFRSQIFEAAHWFNDDALNFQPLKNNRTTTVPIVSKYTFYRHINVSIIFTCMIYI